jgi:multisubunit Na+/H+ antiporter MnhE subunit
MLSTDYIIEFFGNIILIFTFLYFSSNYAITAILGGLILGLIIFIGGLHNSSSSIPYHPLVAIGLYTTKKIKLTKLLIHLAIEILAALIAILIYTNFFMKKKFIK